MFLGAAKEAKPGRQRAKGRGAVAASRAEEGRALAEGQVATLRARAVVRLVQ